MHIWDACNVTNVTYDRSNAALSEWEVIALHTQPGVGEKENAWSAHGHNLDASFFPPPLYPPEWVMSWVVVGGAHVTPCDIRLTHCCQSLPCALSWTLDSSNERQQLPSQACWQWMMCLFIMADRCHVRHALSPCKVSHAFFFPPAIVLWTKARKHLLEEGAMGKVYDRLKKVEELDGIMDKQENYGHVLGERWRKTKRQKKTESERDWDTEMEEGSHRCGRASGDTSHYGVNCSSGDVVGRAERSLARGVSSNTCMHTQKHSHTHTHMHRGNRENIWICATCLEEVI